MTSKELAKSPLALLDEMRKVVGLMEGVLQDDQVHAETRISDIQGLCWSMVGLASDLQLAVYEELSESE